MFVVIFANYLNRGYKGSHLLNLLKFKKKAEEKNTKWENVYKYFERFCEGKCTFGEITVDFCVKFMEYLQTTPQIHRVDKKLHINTAAGYWSTDAKPSAIKLV